MADRNPTAPSRDRVWVLFCFLIAAALLAASLAIPLLAFSATPSEPPPRAERPTYQLGEKWIRDDGVYELIRIEGDRYIFSAGPNQEVHLTKDLLIAKIQVGQSFWELSSLPILPWPLEVGKWGELTNVEMTASAGSRRWARIVWSIDAYEDVQVPAGTFKAFRISLEVGQVTWGAQNRMNIRTWYSPEVRQIIKMGIGGSWALTGSRREIQVVALDRALAAPFALALDEPNDQTRSANDRLLLTGRATGRKGIAQLTVALNGQEVIRQDERASPKSELPFNMYLPLREGRNVLLVTATDAEGTTKQEARVVFYDKPASPPAPAPPVSRPPATLAPPPAPTVTVPTPVLSPPVVAPPPTPSVPTPAPPAAPVAIAPAPPPVVAPPTPPAPPPVQLTIATPRDQLQATQETIALAGLVSGGKGFTRVVVTLNGEEVARQDEKTSQRTLALNAAIRLRDGANTIVVTATENDGTLHQDIRTVHYEKLIPLTLTVQYPADQMRTTEPSTVLAATASSSKGVALVRVTLNGVEVHRQAERTPQKSVVASLPLTLKAGMNAIVLVASEPDGTSRQEVLTVLYDPPKVAVAPPPPPPPPPSQRWAVIVGVGRYDHPNVPRLRYTVRDAEAIHKVLTESVGFKSEHILLLTDASERKPTYRNLKWALGTFLARSARKDDTVLIFFAGHGAPEADQRGVERDGLAKYLIPSDADPDDLYSTALPMDELQTIFGRIEAERVIVLLDACYSGAAGGRTFVSQKTRAVNVDDLFLERLTRAKGRAIITASRPNEVSLELSEFGHGLFTYYLVQGLKGAADLNRDGIVSLQELYEYVEQQVTQKARSVGANQHPVMKGEMEGVLPLVKVRQ